MRQPSFFRLYDQIAFLVFPVEESDFYRDEETGRTTVKINLKDYPDAVS